MYVQVLAPMGVRVVRLPNSEFGNVQRLKSSLSAHPRTQYAVTAEVCAEAHALAAQLAPLNSEPAGTYPVG